MWYAVMCASRRNCLLSCNWLKFSTCWRLGALVSSMTVFINHIGIIGMCYGTEDILAGNLLQSLIDLQYNYMDIAQRVPKCQVAVFATRIRLFLYKFLYVLLFSRHVPMKIDTQNTVNACVRVSPSYRLLVGPITELDESWYLKCHL